MPDLAAMMGGMAGGGQGGAAGPLGSGMSPEQVLSMMENPAIQQMLQHATQDPAMLQQMMSLNPQVSLPPARPSPRVSPLQSHPSITKPLLMVFSSWGDGTGKACYAAWWRTRQCARALRARISARQHEQSGPSSWRTSPQG